MIREIEIRRAFDEVGRDIHRLQYELEGGVYENEEALLNHISDLRIRKAVLKWVLN